MSSFGKAVPNTVRVESLAALQKIKDGKLNIFAGPLKDRDGIMRISAGKVADSKYIEQMNWVVPGVEGSISK